MGCSPPRTLASSRGARNGHRGRPPLSAFGVGRHNKSVDLPKILILCTVLAGVPHAAALTPFSPTLPPTDLARAFLAAADLDLVLTMTVPGIHDVLLRRAADHAEQASTSEDRRFIWEGCFGPVLIEIVGGNVFVNGGRVEPALRSDSVCGAPRAVT